MSVNGEFETECCEFGEESFKTANASYNFKYTDGSLAVSTTATELVLRWPDAGYLSGSFTMEPPVTQSKRLSVRTAQDFTYDFSELSSADADMHRTAGSILWRQQRLKCWMATKLGEY